MLFLVSALPAFSNSLSPNDILFEITDKYDQVRLGITENSIYMSFSEHVRDTINSELLNQYKRDMQFFADSGGNFAPSSHSYLTTNTVEISFDQITSLEFKNGRLEFGYSTLPEILFEEVLTKNGHKALNSFFLEDLEDFFLTFNKLK